MSASPQAKSATERSVPDQPLAFDARERIEDFDWKGLEDSFHKEIDKCNKDEKKLYEELGNLVNVRTSTIRRTLLISRFSTSTFGQNQ
jgi:hypothetical protein